MYQKKTKRGTMNIVFLGTPDFATNILKSLLNSKHKVVGVVTKIDKPVGRKQILTKSPVKILAQEYDIPVFQFKKMKLEGYDALKNVDADIFITCAYGQIIPQEVLDLPKFGTINVHFSLLPKYRGASPVQWALINGENQTGVTIMKTDAGIDTGDIICQKILDIDATDNEITLFEKLSYLAIEPLLEVLEKFENNTVRFIKQGNDYTYYPMLKKEDAKIDFNSSCEKITNLVRGLVSWPTAYAFLDGKMLKIYEAEAVFGNFGGKNGQIVVCDKSGIIVKCGEGYLKVLKLQLEGSKILNYKEFINGNKILGKVLI